jgi:hypothetical protein
LFAKFILCYLFGTKTTAADFPLHWCVRLLLGAIKIGASSHHSEFLLSRNVRVLEVVHGVKDTKFNHFRKFTVHLKMIVLVGPNKIKNTHQNLTLECTVSKLKTIVFGGTKQNKEHPPKPLTLDSNISEHWS